MQVWSLPGSPAAGVASVLPALVSGIAGIDFAARTLARLNDALPAASWSVYRLRRDGPPRLHLSASHGVADTTVDCFATYSNSGLYRDDRSFAAAEASAQAPVMIRTAPDDLPSPLHRQAIYYRHAMLERLSVAGLDDDGSLLAINLYRHHHQGLFGDAEVTQFAAMAPMLFAIVRRHLELDAGITATPLVDRASQWRVSLGRRCPALTARELDVLTAVLRGLTYDGIAAELGLSVATVKTYRARAFTRLGIHFKSELFAGVMN